jgi:hypothetical protein
LSFTYDIDKRFIDSLDLLTENNPKEALEQIEQQFQQQQNPETKNLLKYFRSKGFVTMREYNQAQIIALDLLDKAVPGRDFFLLV